MVRDENNKERVQLTALSNELYGALYEGNKKARYGEVVIEDNDPIPSVDFTEDKSFQPSYYKPVFILEEFGEEVDVLSVIQAWNLNFELGSAVKYILRYGRKPGTNGDKDLHKAMELIQRYLRRKDGQKA